MERLVSGDAPSLGASSVSAFHFGYPTTLAECRLEDRALLMTFLWHVRVPGWLSKVCRYVGTSTFGIYLIHDVMPLGKHLYWIPERYLYESLGAHPTVCIVLSAIITFVMCLMIDSVRRLLVVGLKAKAEPLLRQVDAKWEALLN